MSIPYAVSIQAVWKKDQKRVESKTNPKIGGKKPNSEDLINIGNFNGEKLSLISSMFRDKGASNMSEKMSSVVIKISKSDKSKNVGMVTINLAKFLENT